MRGIFRLLAPALVATTCVTSVVAEPAKTKIETGQTVTPAAPPPIILAPSSFATRGGVFDVSVTASGLPIWQGSVGEGITSFESLPFCPELKVRTVHPGRPKAERLNIQISRLHSPFIRRNPDGLEDEYDVKVRWTRQLGDCQGRSSDTTGFQRLISIRPGESVELLGDHGLTVQLTWKR